MGYCPFEHRAGRRQAQGWAQAGAGHRQAHGAGGVGRATWHERPQGEWHGRRRWARRADARARRADARAQRERGNRRTTGAREALAAWVRGLARVVHLVHSACFWPDLTRYFFGVRFLDVVHEPGS